MASDTTQQAGGWYADPTDRFIYRYWDSIQWTNQVSGGDASTTTDDVPMHPPSASTPPVPGTEAPSPAQPAAQPAIVVTQKGRSSFAAVIGVVLVLLVIVVIVVGFANQPGDDSTSNPSSPVTTQAPATTSAP